MPDCGLVITLRPPPLPTMPRRASVVSVQMSALELVETWLLSGAEALPLPLGVPPLGLLPELP